jgi:gluconokinase
MTPVVIMGVAGSGKSTVGKRLAETLHRPFLDADDLHTASARARMASGIPLQDADRWPWLDRVGAWLSGHPGGVASCSALRRTYRDRLREHTPDALFVLLDVPEPVLTQRLAVRAGHFMPLDLLHSQLATLERLAEDERGVTVDGTEPLQHIVRSVVAAVDWRPPGHGTVQA